MDVYAIGLLLLGFVVGTINAATGVGWGIINVPVLLVLPILQPRQAVAVSLITALFSSGMATVENIRHGLIHWKYAAFLAAGGIGGGFLGAYFLRDLPVITLKRGVGAIAVAVGVKLLFSR